MLFGAGILLMTGRAEASGRSPAALHYRRMGWLILFGLLHAHLLWNGDILYSYGVCGLLIYLFRKRSPATLLIVGLLIMSITPAIMMFSGWTMPHWPAGVAEALRRDLWMPDVATAARETAAYRGGWLAQMGQRSSDSLDMETSFFLFWTAWRVTGLMLAGMALFKLGVLGGKRSSRFYATLIALAVFVGIPVILYGTHRDFAIGWDFRESFFFGTQYNYWASILVGLGWIGTATLFSRAPALSGITTRLAAVGRMAFTNYIMHSVICTTIFYGHGLGLFGRVNRTTQFAIVVAIWLLQLTVSPIWLRHFHFGPLEWLWRSLTYLRWEPFARQSAATRNP